MAKVDSLYKILHTELGISALVSRIQTKSETNCGGSHRCRPSSAGFPLQRGRIFCEHHQFTGGKICLSSVAQGKNGQTGRCPYPPFWVGQLVQAGLCAPTLDVRPGCSSSILLRLLVVFKEKQTYPLLNCLD